MGKTTEMTADTVTINGVTYHREGVQTAALKDSPVRIVVLQRGWVMVGRWSQDGEMCALDNAHVIRVWGTKKGLGEIAVNGPTSTTVLDPCSHVNFHILTTVVVLTCAESKWSL